jgi:hypothetical protein
MRLDCTSDTDAKFLTPTLQTSDRSFGSTRGACRRIGVHVRQVEMTLTVVESGV